MEFAILGPVAVWRDGREVSLGGPKQRALLALLLLDANRGVSRERLTDGLWGERPPPSAAHTLDDYVSRLRKGLGPDRLVRHPPGYLLRVRPGELDLERFERLVAEGRAALAGGHPGRAASVLRAALALWRGPALADVLNEPFARYEANRLEDLRLDAVQERVEADLELGRATELVAELERLARDHPLRERLVGQLMLALYRAGRQAAALEAFRAARTRLVTELGLEPGQPLQRLERRILDQDPALDVAPARRVPVASPRPRRRVLLGALAGIVVAAVAGAFVARPAGTPASDPAPSGGGLVRLDARSGAVAAVASAGAIESLADTDHAVWLADVETNELLRADPTSGKVADRVPLAAQPGAVAAGDGNVWVAETGGASLERVATATGRVTQTLQLAGTPAGLCLCAGGLWVTEPGARSIVQLDSRTGAVRRTVRLPVAPSALTIADGSLWVASYDAGTATAVDPGSGAVIGSVHVGQGPAAIAAGGGAVWVANRLDGTVSRIDPDRAAVSATIPATSEPDALAFAGGSLWVAGGRSETVARIDPARGAVAGLVSVGGEPRALGASGGSLWVGSAPAAARRGGTLVTLTTDRFASIDPQVEYNSPPAEFLGLTTDGLVAYDHTAGSDGLRLVPDLALAVAPPTDGGRSYVFRLRPGMRYADGRPVLASDFARAMVRLFRVGSPGAGFFAGVVGGRACARTPATCTLAGGVSADDDARTIAFRLTAPDPQFLPKLALGFVVPIPAGTPMHAIGTHPIPGTGPYALASVGAREIRMVRNPRFREWSAAAQPEGNPDELVWRFGSPPDREADAVTAGRADWTDDTPADLTTLARRHPGLIHSNAFPGERFVQLNTRVPPFNDLRARRALNLAVDREAIVATAGGPLASVPTCQFIPAGLPGYRPYCPYTLHPGSDGRWIAPDVARARALVAASGTRRMRISVWSVSDTGSPEPVADTLVAALRSLGYPARARVLTSDQIARLPARARWAMQLIPVDFGPDYPSASELYSLFLACRGAYTWRQFCNPRLDRLVHRAETLELTAPRRAAALWARLDRDIVRQAPWVPLVDERIIDIQSPRLRNYQFSPVYHFLPAQAELR